MEHDLVCRPNKLQRNKVVFTELQWPGFGKLHSVGLAPLFAYVFDAIRYVVIALRTPPLSAIVPSSRMSCKRSKLRLLGFMQTFHTSHCFVRVIMHD